MSERGQTEVLGYVLIFSTIVVTIALVMVSGQAGLADLRDTQRTANVEEGFKELAENMDDVVRGGAPSRATEFDLSGERLSLGSPTTIEIEAAYPNGSVAFSHSRSFRPVIYRAQNGAELTYAGGGVIARGKDGGMVMLREPSLLLSSDRSIIPVIQTTFDRQQLRGGSESVDRESRVLIRMEHRKQRTLSTTERSVEVSISMESSRAPAWEEYLESIINPGTDDCTLNDNTVSCDPYTSDQTTVILSRVAISFN